MSLLLYGYFGHRNFGDDLLVSLACRLCRDLGYQGKIDLASDARGVGYLPRLVTGFDNIVPMTRRAHRLIWGRYDKVLFAGGGTVFDYRTSMSPAYRLRKRISDTVRFGFPRMIGTRYASIGIGIGPFATTEGKRVALHRLKYHDWLSVRDHESFKHAAHVCKGQNSLSIDLSLLEASRLRELAKEIDRKPNAVGMLVRSFRFGDVGNRYLEAMRHAAQILENRGVDVHWLSFQPQYDHAALEMLPAGSQIWRWDPETMNFDDVYRKFACFNTLVTARMHGTYVGGMLGVPTIGIELHPKIRFAAEEFSYTSVLRNALASRILRTRFARRTGCRTSTIRPFGCTNMEFCSPRRNIPPNT